MTIGMYRSVNGVARKLTKRYRDVNGVAREITKRYRDVNGVARLTFHSGDSSVLFDASNGGSKIYGNSSTVQPPAIAVTMWKRTK
jgi:hypothetical protein